MNSGRLGHFSQVILNFNFSSLFTPPHVVQKLYGVAFVCGTKIEGFSESLKVFMSVKLKRGHKKTIKYYKSNP